MARPAELDTQIGYANDGYTIVVVVEARVFDPDATWRAQARRRTTDSDPVATFVVTARAGTVDDPATGGELDETGNTVVVLYLDGLGTGAAVGESIVDVEEQPAAGDPVTWVRFPLIIQGDATR